MEHHTPYVQTYDTFYLACLTEEMQARTCDYWYTIMSKSYSHTAFHAVDELMDWLNERNLTLTDTLPAERGTHKWMRINGVYKRASYLDVEAFKAVKAVFNVAELDNGDYTLGKVTEEFGEELLQRVRTIHLLNCNIHNRVEFPYHQIRDRVGDYKQLIKNSPDVQKKVNSRWEPFLPWL
jgi:hypothetical protein